MPRRGRQIALIQQKIPEPVVSFDAFGVGAKYPTVFGGRLIESSLRSEDSSKVVAGKLVPRTHLQSGTILLKRHVPLSLRFEQCAQRGMGIIAIRIGGQRGAEMRLGQPEFALLGQFQSNALMG